ncbi:MAG TPA: 4'-phosphopantetheinyl transferase superfamily protein [Solirubrobacteraceae bacterium]|jgi:4'-phosphopantetheinyl transferase EntD
MIEEILPASVIAVEARHDSPSGGLFTTEEAVVEHAVEKRRREFTTGRACAHDALEQLGLPPSPILSGERGEPRWPAEVVGSITHCDGYRGCAVARISEIATVGIDAEVNAALPEGIEAAIARPEELAWLRELKREAPAVHWDRLLFSAKESVYKAWFPLTKLWLDFEEASIVVDPSTGTFFARLLVPGPLLGERRVTAFSGKWLVRDGLILTAIALPPPIDPAARDGL